MEPASPIGTPSGAPSRGAEPSHRCANAPKPNASAPPRNSPANAVFRRPKNDKNAGWETPKSRRKGRSAKPQGDQTVPVVTSPKSSHIARPSSQKGNQPSAEEDSPRFPVAEVDSRFGRAGEWPFVEDYTYRIERMAFPVRKKPDPLLLPKEVPVRGPPSAGWLVGFTYFPRDILLRIFMMVCDYDLMRQLRRVCSGWRKFISTLPMHVRETATRKQADQEPVTVPAISRLLHVSSNIVSLELDGVILPCEPLEKLTVLAHSLTNLSFAAHNSWDDYDVRALLHLTRLESLSVHGAKPWPLVVSRHKYNSAGFTRLHTLKLFLLRDRETFCVDDDTLFPALTSFLLWELDNYRYAYQLKSVAITNLGVRTQLTHVSFQRVAIEKSLFEILMGPGLQHVQLLDCRPSYYQAPVTPAVNASVRHLDIRGSHFADTLVPHYPQLTYLDWSGCDQFACYWFGDLPQPQLEVLRGIRFPVSRWINKLNNFPRLRQAILQKDQLIPQFSELLQKRGIEVVYADEGTQK